VAFTRRYGAALVVPGSVVTCAGVRTRPDQAVTSAASLPAVDVGPENRKVVRPCGSDRGSHGTEPGLICG
jgi:hypothetical protein